MTALTVWRLDGTAEARQLLGPELIAAHLRAEQEATFRAVFGE